MDAISLQASNPKGYFDSPFEQQVHEAHPMGNRPEVQDVLAIEIDSTGTIFAKTRAGIFSRSGKDDDWCLEEKEMDFRIHEKRERAARFVPEEGFPLSDITCVVRAEDKIWVGTSRGVAVYDDVSWSVRRGRRWLLHDEVRDIAVDARGVAWIATAAGISAIGEIEMTLDRKASLFQGVLERRHIREPALVGRCSLREPGDLSSWEPTDDDNDGQYTAMYLMMESCRYAATGNREAKDRARKAFDALVFLQTVTQTPGFVARTVIPSSWTRMHDANRTYTEEEWSRIQAKDPRNKRVETRWHLSSDGTWFWKCDTSSDEITGHFCGYLFYYLLVEDASEKERIRNHVCKIMDHIVDHGFRMVDVDGEPTRWGVWAPESLNEDPRWKPERYHNSLEILSFLKVTYFMTGDEKYQREYEKLLREHGYLDNIRNRLPHSPLTYSNIDNELAALTFPGLIWCETDTELLQVYRECLDHWFEGVRSEGSPYFNFTYGMLAGQDPCIEASSSYLRTSPLDLIDWRMDNTGRKDLEYKRFPSPESLQTHPLPPASERAVTRWDKNPWVAIQGGDGVSEWCPNYWLLPYWMGRWQGFIQ